MKQFAETVETPTNLDILCGRGMAHFKHEGNIRFRMIIATHVDKYQRASSRHEKTDVIRTIAHDILKAGGRFLKKPPKSFGASPWWYVMGLKCAYHKVGHSLRDACGDKIQCMTKMRRALKTASKDETSQNDCLLEVLKAGSARSFEVEAESLKISDGTEEMMNICRSPPTSMSPDPEDNQSHGNQNDENLNSSISEGSSAISDTEAGAHHPAAMKEMDCAPDVSLRSLLADAALDLAEPLFGSAQSIAFWSTPQSHDDGVRNDASESEDADFARNMRNLLEDVQYTVDCV